MNFIKAHYEKIILGALILALIGVLAWLSTSIEQTAHISDRDLKAYKTNPDHETTDFSRPEFSPDAAFTQGSLWQDRDGVTTEKLIYKAELVAPFKGARCDNPDCKKIIPLETMKRLLKCPYCGKELKAPPEVSEDALDLSGADTDQDGMPDAYELKMGFNMNDPYDALADTDGDGFCNLYEMLMGTDAMNGKIYPNMDKRLCLTLLKKTPLQYRLVKVTPSDKPDKHTWTIQIYDRKNKQDSFWEYEQEIEIQKKLYKLSDVQIVAASTMEAVAQDKVSIILTPVADPNGPQITMNAGENAYAPDQKAVLLDVPTNKTYTVGVNESFTIGGKNTEKATFQVIAVDPIKETATLLNQETGTETLLKRISAMEDATKPGMKQMRRNGGLPYPGGMPSMPESGTPRRNR